MGERGELGKREATLMRKVQELEQKRKALDPKLAISYEGHTEETEPVTDIEKRLNMVDKVDRELEEAKAELRKIREKISKLK